MADIVTLAKEELKLRGEADAAALAARAVSGEADDQELLENQSMIPTWRERDYTDVPVGTPYQWDGMIYRLVQAHDATGNPGWTPDAVPALWAAVSAPGEAGTAEDPITAARGMEYEYGSYYRDPEDGQVYFCARVGEADGGKVVLQYLPHELVGQYFTQA